LKQGGKFENLAGNLKIWREIKKNWREVWIRKTRT
jgi:hypothetical protein